MTGEQAGEAERPQVESLTDEGSQHPCASEANKANSRPTDVANPTSGKASDTIPHDETDGRKRLEWKSRYPDAARLQIRIEASAVAFVSLGSLLMIFLLWSGMLGQAIHCAPCARPVFLRYGYFFWGGVLGGTLFGIKYLYHVVAKGFWNQDRCLWRVLSPLLAGSLAFVVGALTDAGFLGLTISASKAPAFLSLGFVTGYFSDKALAKMTEIAEVIFSTRDQPKQNGLPANRNGQSQDA